MKRANNHEPRRSFYSVSNEGESCLRSHFEDEGEKKLARALLREGWGLLSAGCQTEIVGSQWTRPDDVAYFREYPYYYFVASILVVLEALHDSIGRCLQYIFPFKP